MAGMTLRQKAAELERRVSRLREARKSPRDWREEQRVDAALAQAECDLRRILEILSRYSGQDSLRRPFP